MNTIVITGNLTREPETRAVGEQSVINFSIANNDESRKQADGSYVKIASFFECEYWTKNPAHWLKLLTKGTQVMIQGRLKQERWEQDGQNRSRVKISVEGYPLIAAVTRSEAPSKPPVQAGPEAFDDDSIPF